MVSRLDGIFYGPMFYYDAFQEHTIDNYLVIGTSKPTNGLNLD